MKSCPSSRSPLLPTLQIPLSTGTPSLHPAVALKKPKISPPTTLPSLREWGRWLAAAARGPVRAGSGRRSRCGCALHAPTACQAAWQGTPLVRSFPTAQGKGWLVPCSYSLDLLLLFTKGLNFATLLNYCHLVATVATLLTVAQKRMRMMRSCAVAAEAGATARR